MFATTGQEDILSLPSVIERKFTLLNARVNPSTQLTNFSIACMEIPTSPTVMMTVGMMEKEDERAMQATKLQQVSCARLCRRR